MTAIPSQLPLKQENTSSAKVAPTNPTIDKVIYVGGALQNAPPIILNRVPDTDDDFGDYSFSFDDSENIELEINPENDSPNEESPVPAPSTTPQPDSGVSALGEPLKVENKFTPLTKACREGDLAQVEKLISEGADLTAPDKNGHTPMTAAADAGHIEIVRLLAKKGVDPDDLDANGRTPLFYAIIKDNLELGRFLIDELVVELDAPDGQQQFPLEHPIWTTGRERWLPILEEAGADPKMVKEWVERKFLAHVWGQGGTTELHTKEFVTHTLQLGGLPDEAAIAMISRYVAPFIQDNASIAPHVQEELLDILDNAVVPTSKVTNAELVWRVQHNKPIVIFGGWDEDGHSLSFVVTGNRLFLCNRGDDIGNDHAVMAYALDKSQIDEAFIQILRTSYPTKDEFIKAIASLYLTVVKNECIKMSDQTNPNCILSSIKIAMRALLQVYGDDGRLYKEFTAHIRKAALFGYLEVTQNPDVELLDAIAAKLVGKVAKGKAHYNAENFELLALFRKMSEVTGKDYYGASDK